MYKKIEFKIPVLNQKLTFRVGYARSGRNFSVRNTSRSRWNRRDVVDAGVAGGPSRVVLDLDRVVIATLGRGCLQWGLVWFRFLLERQVALAVEIVPFDVFQVDLAVGLGLWFGGSHL